MLDFNRSMHGTFPCYVNCTMPDCNNRRSHIIRPNTWLAGTLLVSYWSWAPFACWSSSVSMPTMPCIADTAVLALPTHTEAPHDAGPLRNGRLQQQLTSSRARQPPMMTVRCMLRHVCKLGFTSTTACTVAASLRTNTVCKRQSNQRLTDSAQSWQVEKGSQTWTAAGLMERQPLMLRLLRLRSFRAHAAMEASVSLRQQCRPRDLNALQFSATATTPMSCTCRTFCSA